MKGGRSLFLAALVAAGCSAGDGGQAMLQEESDPTAAVVEIARFRDARAVSSDPAGRLYVVDAASSTVSVLSAEGEILSTFGGPGSGDYSLLDPADVDPSNGLDLFIADLGNARIQRISRDGEFIESIRVPAGDPQALLGAVDQEGRPVAVSVGPSGGIYAVEAERRTVIRWEGDRRLSRILGQPEHGPGEMVEPVGIAVSSDGTVFVADSGHESVLVFDELGSFRRAISARPSGGVVAVALAPSLEGERLLIVGTRSVAVHDLAAGLLEVVRPITSEDLVSASVANGELFVLTQTRLLYVE